MSSPIFFKLGSTDLSPAADVQNWKVNKVDVWQEWTDGNWTDHREIVRQRVEGSFRLGFKRETDWSDYATLLAAAKNAAGYYSLQVYVNNTAASETVDAFLEISAANKWDLVNSRFWRVVDVKLTER